MAWSHHSYANVSIESPIGAQRVVAVQLCVGMQGYFTSNLFDLFWLVPLVVYAYLTSETYELEWYTRLAGEWRLFALQVTALSLESTADLAKLLVTAGTHRLARRALPVSQNRTEVSSMLGR